MSGLKRLAVSACFIWLFMIVAAPDLCFAAETTSKIVDIHPCGGNSVVLFDGTDFDIDDYLFYYPVTVDYEDGTSENLFPVSSAPEEGGRTYTIEAGNGEKITLTLRSRDTGELASFIYLYGDHDTNFIEDCNVVMPGDYTISVSCGELTETVPLRVDLSGYPVLSLDTQDHVGVTIDEKGHYTDFMEKTEKYNRV